MNLRTQSYLEQLQRWPKTGQHILAQFDADTVVVLAIAHGKRRPGYWVKRRTRVQR